MMFTAMTYQRPEPCADCKLVEHELALSSTGVLRCWRCAFYEAGMAALLARKDVELYARQNSADNFRLWAAHTVADAITDVVVISSRACCEAFTAHVESGRTRGSSNTNCIPADMSIVRDVCNEAWADLNRVAR